MSGIEILIAMLLIIGLVALFSIGMYLNNKTPLPKEMELPSLACQHCKSSSCSYSEVRRDMKQEIKRQLKESVGEN